MGVYGQQLNKCPDFQSHGINKVPLSGFGFCLVLFFWFCSSCCCLFCLCFLFCFFGVCMFCFGFRMLKMSLGSSEIDDSSRISKNTFLTKTIR